MHLHIDQYAHLSSPIHRWQARPKFIVFFSIIVLYSLVQDLRLVPLMLAITCIFFVLSRLPLHFLMHRLKYPGIFLFALVVILPFMTGTTIIWEWGFLALRQEGVIYMLLVVSRFISILTMTVILFGTTTFVVSVRTLRSMGIPSLLADMLLLTMRYTYELADMLVRMQQAMRLRGFQLSKLNGRSLSQLSGLLGSLLIRSFEQSERVYKAMKVRGYGSSVELDGVTLLDEETSMTITPTDITALELQDVYFAYPQRPPVLNKVSLTIKDKERVGLIGPNGAGKTSLLLSICGVINPTEGTISAYNEPVVAGKYNQQIGMVFQNANDQLFSPTVHEDVAFGPVNIGLDAAIVEQRVESALLQTGAMHLRDRISHHLSGGEKRMVAIATVLALQPGIVLYDEPDANLDMRSRRRLIDFLQQAPHTVLVASHDLEMILEVCDRVILFDDGNIVADGEPRVIMANVELMENHGLEKPHSLIPHRHADGSTHEKKD